MGEGTTFGLSVPLIPHSVIVTDPKCLEYVLKQRADNFIKGKRFYEVGGGAGGLLSTWLLGGASASLVCFRTA